MGFVTSSGFPGRTDFALGVVRLKIKFELGIEPVSEVRIHLHSHQYCAHGIHSDGYTYRLIYMRKMREHWSFSFFGNHRVIAQSIGGIVKVVEHSGTDCRVDRFGRHLGRVNKS